MWDLLLVNASLATMTEGTPYGVVVDGAIGIEDNTLVFVGPRSALTARPEELAAEVIDCAGGWILPGLVDCHTHVVYGGNRSEEFEQRLNGVSYEEIARMGGGILSTVRATRSASEDELFASAERRLRALRHEGLTTVEIKSGYGLETATEMRMLHVARRLGDALPLTVRTTFLGAHALPPEFNGRADEYVDVVCHEMLPAVAAEGLADAVDGFCERIAFSVDQMERVFKAAGELGLPVKLHAEQLSDMGGARLLATHRGLSADHLEYLGEDGVRALAESGAIAVLLPGAFYVLRETRVPPVDLLRSHGVPMALATDCNPGSSPVTSLLLMLSMGCTLFGLTPEEALAGITRNAARALGLAVSHGTLEPGKVADLAVFDIDRPADLAYAVGANPCTTVVSGGRLVLQR